MVAVQYQSRSHVMELGSTYNECALGCENEYHVSFQLLGEGCRVIYRLGLMCFGFPHVFWRECLDPAV